MATPTLADALAAAAQDGRQQGHVEALLDTLSKQDAAVLLDALNGPLSSARISRALDAVGTPVGRNAIDGWRSRHGNR